MKSQGFRSQRQYNTQVEGNRLNLTEKQNIALSNGDVLTEIANEPGIEAKQNPRFSAWRM